MSYQQNQNQQRQGKPGVIFKQASGSGVVEVKTTGFDIGKVTFTFQTFGKGNSSKETHDFFIDFADFEVLRLYMLQVFNGQAQLGEKTKLMRGGDSQNGGIESRVLEITQGKNKPYALQLTVGPGKKVGQGAVSPDGKSTFYLAIPIDTEEFTSCMTKLHIEAYVAAAHMRNKFALSPQEFDYNAGKRQNNSNNSNNNHSQGGNQNNRGGQGNYNGNRGGQGNYNGNRGSQGNYNGNRGSQGNYNGNRGSQGNYNGNRGGQGNYNGNRGGQGNYNGGGGYGGQGSVPPPQEPPY